MTSRGRLILVIGSFVLSSCIIAFLYGAIVDIFFNISCIPLGLIGGAWAANGKESLT